MASKNWALGKPQMVLRKGLFGFGVFDVNFSCYSEQIKSSYFCWSSMIRRCYDEKYQISKPTYKDCYVCDEWKYFSNFKKWFDQQEYKDGYVLDKDILFKGNKIYSPQTCCFVPPEINTLLLNDKSKRKSKNTPLGVIRSKYSFVVRISKNGSNVYIGSFKDIKDAFNAYKQAKEQYIREIAKDYFEQGKITQKIYDALIKYEINIDD